MIRKRAIHIGVANPGARGVVAEASASKLEEAKTDAVTTRRDAYVTRSVNAVEAICREFEIQSTARLMGTAAKLCDVEAAFNRAVAEIGDDGLLVVSFAGHGRLQPRNENDENDEPDRRHTAWLLHDHALSDHELHSWLHRVPAECSVIIVGDCCGAGGMDLGNEVVGTQNPNATLPVLPRASRVWLCAVDKKSVWAPGATEKTFAEEVERRVKDPAIKTYRLLQDDLEKHQPINQRSVIKCRPERLWDAAPFVKPI